MPTTNTITPAQRLALGLVDVGAFLPGPDNEVRRLLREVGSFVEMGSSRDGLTTALAAVHHVVQKATDSGRFDLEICLLSGFFALVVCDGRQ